jgi:hypothetical protein
MASIKGAEILRSGRLHRRGYTGTEIPTIRVSQKKQDVIPEQNVWKSR